MSGIGHNTAAGKQLRALVERIEYLNEEIAKQMAGRNEVFLEAKSLGFCTKTIKQIIKLRQMTEPERQEAEALLELYKGALGMLNGTPLGDFARKRMMETPPHDPETGEILEEKPEQQPTKPDLAAEEAAPEPPKETVDQARETGRAAAREGKTVIENPYPAGDAKRAAWDEGWCEEQGSDGMGIPPAWRRSTPKPVDPPPPSNGAGGAP